MFLKKITQRFIKLIKRKKRKKTKKVFSIVYPHINIDRLRKAILNNDEQIYLSSPSGTCHYDIPDDEFYKLLPKWLKTNPDLKCLILETKQFKKLPYEIQLDVITSAVKKIADGKLLIKYFPQKAMKDIYIEDIFAAYRVLVEDITTFNYTRGMVITPPLSINEVDDMFVSLYVIYPSTVPLAVSIYKFITLLRKLKEKKVFILENENENEFENVSEKMLTSNNSANFFPIDCNDKNLRKKLEKIIKMKKNLLIFKICEQAFTTPSFIIHNLSCLLLKT